MSDSFIPILSGYKEIILPQPTHAKVCITGFGFLSAATITRHPYAFQSRETFGHLSSSRSAHVTPSRKNVSRQWSLHALIPSLSIGSNVNAGRFEPPGTDRFEAGISAFVIALRIFVKPAKLSLGTLHLFSSAADILSTRIFNSQRINSMISSKVIIQFSSCHSSLRFTRADVLRGRSVSEDITSWPVFSHFTNDRRNSSGKTPAKATNGVIAWQLSKPKTVFLICDSEFLISSFAL